MYWIISGEVKMWVAICDHIFLFSLVLSQFYKIPPTNPKFTFVPHQFGIRAEFLAFFPSTKIHFKKREITVHVTLFINPAQRITVSKAISYPFGVRFTFRLKRWMRDWVLDILKKVRGNWTTDLTFTSFCLVLVLFLQQKINISGPFFSPIWAQFEPLRFFGNFWLFFTEFSLWGFAFMEDT